MIIIIINVNLTTFSNFSICNLGEINVSIMFTFQNGERGSDGRAKDGPTVSPLHHSKFDISTDNDKRNNADTLKKKNWNTDTNKFFCVNSNNRKNDAIDNNEIGRAHV